MSQYAGTTPSDVASTLCVVRRLTFLRRLVWTFNTEPIPLSRRVLSDGDKEQTDAVEHETVTIADLQLLLHRCIPQVDVQLKVCRL